MKKLLTNFNGKMPWFLDDWRFQNDEYLSLFNALANSYYSQVGFDVSNFILSGCIVTDEGAQWKITEGWCVIQRRFVRVKETFVNKDNTQNFVLKMVTTIDTAGDRVTADNNPI